MGDDLKVQVNARLPERLMVQRDWLAHRLGPKKQDVLEVALREWVQARLRDLGLEDQKGSVKNLGQAACLFRADRPG